MQEDTARDFNMDFLIAPEREEGRCYLCFVLVSLSWLQKGLSRLTFDGRKYQPGAQENKGTISWSSFLCVSNNTKKKL